MSFLTGLLNRGSNVNIEELVASACKSSDMLCTVSRDLSALEKANSTITDDDATITSHDNEERSIEKKQIEIKEWMEKIGKELTEIRIILVGDDEKDVDEERASKLANAALENNLLRSIASVVIYLPLESSKNAAHIFANLMNRKVEGDTFAAQIISEGGYALDALAKAYGENDQVALACGTMLKEAARHEIINIFILRAAFFWRFLTVHVHNKDFGIAADAFDLLRQLLTLHPHLAAKFLAENYAFFFECYNRLLGSENYVTCRESLRLLSDILLDRANYQIMIQYIANKDHLKILMLQLRSKKTRIQLEAFHVFKIFVANPNKDPAIIKVLYQNKDKLINYLADFHSEKDSDEQFFEERQLILDSLLSLQQANDEQPTTE